MAGTPPRGVARLVHLAVGGFLTSRPGRTLHLALDRATGGRILPSVRGLATIVLMTTGRRTGRRIAAPLSALVHGPAWVVIASNGGRERPPQWLLNLRAEPRATVRAGRRTLEVVAREAGPDEHAALWPRIVERYAGYETYRARTSREIPLVLLEPAADPARAR